MMELKRVMEIQIRTTCILSPILQLMIALSHLHFVTGCPKDNSKIVMKETKTKTHNWWGLMELAYIGSKMGRRGECSKWIWKVWWLSTSMRCHHSNLGRFGAIWRGCGVLIGYTPRNRNFFCRVGPNYHTITCIHYIISRLPIHLHAMHTFHRHGCHEFKFHEIGNYQ